MEPFLALSSHDLPSTLQKYLVPVPPRTKGRKTSHTESWVTCHFLMVVAESDLLEYPLCVEPGDRPDLVLSSQSGKTGIEITEAVSQVGAWVDAHAEREGISGTRFIPPHYVNEERSKEEIDDIARGMDPSQKLPHMGDQIEQNWIEAMMHRVKCKAKKFTSPGFSEPYRNWLLIYDNWSPAVHGYHDVATPLAQGLYNREWRNPFEKVFILRGGHTVWEFSCNAEIMKLHVSGQSSYSIQLTS